MARNKYVRLEEEVKVLKQNSATDKQVVMLLRHEGCDKAEVKKILRDVKACQ